MGLAGTLGALVAEVPGFILGAAGTAVTMPVILSETRVNIPPVPDQVAGDPEDSDAYRNTYLLETKKLRRKSIFSGQLATGLVSLGVVLVSALILVSY
jgi:hypothetical protein